MKSTPDESEIYLVVDGGGTKTDCQLLTRTGDEFVVLGQGQSTASNPGALGVDPAALAIHSAIELARRDANLDREIRVHRAALAIAGTVDPNWGMELKAALAKYRIAREYRVFPDVLPPVLSASLVGPAAAIIAGTGSAAIARGTVGDYHIAGGWGYLLGDEGSGYGIGRDALRVTLGELERGTPHSPLVKRVLAHYDAQSSAELKQVIYSAEHPKTAIAELTPVVLELAGEHDPAASILLSGAVDELHATLLRVLTRLNLAGAALPLAIAGGMFRSTSPLRDRVRESLLASGQFAKVDFVDSPLVAARLLLTDEVFNEPFRFVL